MKDDIVHTWIKASLGLEPGEEYFFICEDKKERSRLFRRVLNELNELSKIDPHGAASLVVLPTYRGKKFLIRILKRQQSLLFAQKISKDGKVEIVSLVDDSARRKRILLMIQDGLNLEEVNEALEPKLSVGERKEFFNE